MTPTRKTYTVTVAVSSVAKDHATLQLRVERGLRSMGIQLLASVQVEEQPCEHAMGYRTVNGQRQCQTCGLSWDKVQEEYVLGKQG